MVENELIFIPGNVPSSKNSRINTKHGSFASKTVKGYLNSLGIQSYSSSKKIVKGYVNKPNVIEGLRESFLKQTEGKELPLEIGFHFVRDSKRKADFHNLVQLPLDLMTSFGIINDDNMDESFAVPLLIDNKFYSINKDFPGVYVDLILK